MTETVLIIFLDPQGIPCDPGWIPVTSDLRGMTFDLGGVICSNDTGKHPQHTCWIGILYFFILNTDALLSDFRFVKKLVFVWSRNFLRAWYVHNGGILGVRSEGQTHISWWSNQSYNTAVTKILQAWVPETSQKPVRMTKFRRVCIVKEPQWACMVGICLPFWAY